MSVGSPAPKHIPFLDLVRAVAVVAVVWFHAWQLSWYSPVFTVGSMTVDLSIFVRTGFLGVEFFLFISGFCLMYPLAVAHINDPCHRLKMGRYAWRRFIKIVPSYALATLVMVWVLRDDYATTGTMLSDTFAHLFFVHNFWRETFGSINGAFWSLAIEVQFYLIFPFIAGYFLRRPLTMSVAMTAIAIGYRLGTYRLAGSADSFYFNQLPGMLDLYAGGMWSAMVLASLFHMKANLNGGKAFVLKVAALIFAGLGSYSFAVTLDWVWQHNNDFGYWQVHYRTALVPVLVILSLSVPLTFHFVNRLIANPLVSFLSATSYNLYLWHVFILQSLYHGKFPQPRTENVHEDPAWELEFLLIGVCLSILAAMMTTYWFEQPLLKWGKKKSGPPSTEETTRALAAIARPDIDKAG